MEARWCGPLEAERASRLDAVNPALTPRNHRVEEAIKAAVAGDLSPFERFLAAWTAPFDPPPEAAPLRRPAEDGEAVTATFCGT